MSVQPPRSAARFGRPWASRSGRGVGPKAGGGPGRQGSPGEAKVWRASGRTTGGRLGAFGWQEQRWLAACPVGARARSRLAWRAAGLIPAGASPAARKHNRAGVPVPLSGRPDLPAALLRPARRADVASAYGGAHIDWPRVYRPPNDPRQYRRTPSRREQAPGPLARVGSADPARAASALARPRRAAWAACCWTAARCRGSGGHPRAAAGVVDFARAAAGPPRQ
jgi:hypothetical protein